MPIGITAEHEELHEVVRRFAESHAPAVRAAAEADHDARPGFWDALAELGWLGLHVPEASGGSGYGAVELAVVLEAFGVACLPGPYLPTVLAAALLADAAAGATAKAWLPQLSSGATVATVALEGHVAR